MKRILVKNDDCRDVLFGEGKQRVKQSFKLLGLSVSYFMVGVLYMIKGFPTYFVNKYIKKKGSGVMVCELFWEGQGGVDVRHHFPFLKKKKNKILKMAVGRTPSETPHRTNPKHPDFLKARTTKTYEDVMAEKDQEDSVYHFGTGKDGKEIVK